jgi:dipeptidyl aminopeptidase/acylaminoacyl peptidase
VQQGALRVQGFDPEREALVGDPVTLAESAATFTVSTTGIVAHRASHDRRTQIAWFDRKGLLLRLLSQSGLNGPELSPDDLRLAGDGAPDGNRDIWVRDLARDTITRFTTDPAQEGYPLWSPDGAWIAFESKRKGTFDIWIKPSSGASAEELLLEQPEHEWPIDWSKDGRFLLYQRATLRGVWDLWALPMTGDDRTPVPVATTRFAEHMGEFSPNGRWVVFDTNESGRRANAWLYPRRVAPSRVGAPTERRSTTSRSTAT